MSADVLKEFLVSLGFQIDAGSERRFIDTVAAVTTKAAAMGAAVAGAAVAVTAGVERIADGLEKLYFASQRTGASVENLQATGFAARQMGVDAGAALGTVENLARFLRNSPGGEGFLQSLGVSTREANGHMRDTVDIMGDIGKKLAEMPYYRANAYAQTLGIDERSLQAMRQGMGDFQMQYKEMLRAAGTDSQEAAKSSHEFMTELRLLGASVGVLTQKIVASLTGPIGTQVRRVRETFVANFDLITAAIGSVVEGISRAASALGTLALRGAGAIRWLIDWFQSLNPEAQRTIGIIFAILAAWRVLSAGFLATPVGRVLALGAAIIGLWDDYQVWKEGGKSLIDWGEWAPQIEAALAGMRELGAALAELGGVLGKILGPALKSIGDVLLGAIKMGFGNLLDVVVLITDLLTGKFDQAGERARAMLKRTADFGRESLNTLTNGYRGTVAAAQASIASGGRAGPLAGLGGAFERTTADAEEGKPNPRDPRGIRNFNPGNINYGDWARAHGATGVEAGKGGRFATFANAQAGLNALSELLRSKGYIGGGRDTVTGILEKYAPREDNNDTDMYIRMVSKRLGVDANAHLDPRNLEQMTRLIDGIVRVENGKNPYSREMLSQAAAQGAPVSVSQTTHINVHGANDARSVAQETSKAQNGVNEQLVRNMRGAAF